MEELLKMKQAKSSLILGFPFFGSLLLNCRVIESEEVPTMGTDGKDIFYNREFCKQRTKQDLVFIFAHEVMHKVLVHPMRLAGRDKFMWNVAADYVLNLILEDAGLTVPDDALYDGRFKGMTADEVYRIVAQEQQSKDADGSGGHKLKTKGGGEAGIPDHLIEGKGDKEMTKAERKHLEQEMKQQMANAVAMAKSTGNCPDNISKLVEGLLKPVVNWKEQLQQYITQCKSDERSFKRPNRRMKAHGMYLPSSDGETMPPITLVLDTSGSIYAYEETLRKFMTEMNSIVEDVKPEKVYILNSDTTVHAPKTLMMGEPLDFKIEGGGGTAFSNAFDYINEHHDDSCMVVFFTDLYVSDFGDTDKPVLWVVHDGDKNTQPPFGEVIHIDE